MSRYGGDPRYSAGSHPYREGPPRWDADRFTREREVRYSGPPERDNPYEGYGRRMEDRFASPPRRESRPQVEERTIFAEERYGPPGRRVDRKYWEEDEIYESRPPQGAMVPYRPSRPEGPPPRPGLIRRQSSLDTFDRKPSRRYDEYEREDVRPPPPRIPVPLPPRAPSPRRYDQPRYAEREYEREGDEYRYKEREWTSYRQRNDSGSRERERESVREEEVIEEVGEYEKPFPRRGKTRMPRRLVHTKVLYEMGYPFYEEGEVIIIEKALGKENIDEVVIRSKEFRERETTLLRIEPPPPEIREEFIISKVETVPFEEAPRSVREWDNMTLRSPSPRSKRSHSHSRRRSRSRRTSRSRRGSSPEKPEKIIDVHRDSITVREVSPARTAKSGRSRRGTEVLERREVIEDDFEESNSIHVGPLALIVDHDRRKSRSDKEIRAEIRALEDERKGLRRERKERGETIKVERGELIRERERERSPSRDLIIERAPEEVVEVKKDKKAPDPRILRAMLATLT